jgi:hypothetical protein
MLYSLARVGLASNLFRTEFLTKISCSFIVFCMCTTCSAHVKTNLMSGGVFVDEKYLL